MIAANRISNARDVPSTHPAPPQSVVQEVNGRLFTLTEQSDSLIENIENFLVRAGINGVKKEAEKSGIPPVGDGFHGTHDRLSGLEGRLSYMGEIVAMLNRIA